MTRIVRIVVSDRGVVICRDAKVIADDKVLTSLNVPLSLGRREFAVEVEFDPPLEGAV